MLNHGLIEETFHGVIEDINTQIRIESKNNFEKKPFRGDEQFSVGKDYVVSEPNYHTTKWFSEILLAVEINRVKMNNSAYLSLLILNISTLAMYEY